jgi:hypothetical protein
MAPPKDQLKWHAIRAGVGLYKSPARHGTVGGVSSRVSPHALRRAWATIALNEEAQPIDVVGGPEAQGHLDHAEALCAHEVGSCASCPNRNAGCLAHCHQACTRVARNSGRVSGTSALPGISIVRSPLHRRPAFSRRSNRALPANGAGDRTVAVRDP